MKRLAIISLCLLPFFASCIENDVPYPVSEPAFASFEAEGSKSVTIDSKNSTVTVDLQEDTDIQAVTLKNVVLKNNPGTMTPDLNGVFDLSSPLYCLIHTYADYYWTIKATQEIERYFTVATIVGNSTIDVVNHRVMANVPTTTSLMNIEVKTMKLGPSCATYSKKKEELVNFSEGPLTVNVTAHGRTDTWTIFIQQVSSIVSLKSCYPWAKMAYVTASGIEGRDNGFYYRKKGDTEWIKVPASLITHAGGDFTANIKELNVSTEYEYYAFCDTDVTEVASFVTESAPQLPNSGFETVSNADSKDWISFYDPKSSDPALQTKYWDNGSSASAGMMGAQYAICYSETDVPSGIGSLKSARLQSKYAVVKLAAGNLFVGEFAGLDGTNGMVNFGRPFTGRPIGVRFWYKYQGGKVDYAPDGSPIKVGDYDIASVQFALGTWNKKTYGGSTDCPVQVNTANPKTFWKYKELPETVAYCTLEVTGTGESTGWKKVEIYFDYKSISEHPTHIIVSAASSKYGDYFAGCSTSALWLDEIELIY